jgi:hypothetical protein
MTVAPPRLRAYLARAVETVWIILTPDGKLTRVREAAYAREAWERSCVPFAFAECRILRQITAERSRRVGKGGGGQRRRGHQAVQG